MRLPLVASMIASRSGARAAHLAVMWPMFMTFSGTGAAHVTLPGWRGYHR